MLVLLSVFLLLVLAAVFLEDLLYREVHVFLFPLVFAGLFFRSFLCLEGVELFRQIGCNLALIGFNLLVATVYFSIKHRQLTWLTNGLMGWGDIVFFAALTPILPLEKFCFFFPLSLFFSLLCWLVVGLFKREQLGKVPLAGLQALFTMGYLVMEWVGYV